MNKILPFIAGICFLLNACGDKNGKGVATAPKKEIPLQRFDKDLFSIDSNAVSTALPGLLKNYPVFLPIFVNNILGLGPLSPANPAATEGTKRFLHLTKPVYDTAAIVFAQTSDISENFEQAFRYVRTYFPAYKAPEKIITLIGPIDGLAKMGNEVTPDFIGPDFIGISLQFYLGKNYTAYSDEYFIANVAPQYRSRRFERSYIVPDAMKLVVDDLFPDKTPGKPLIDQIIEKGKQWWLLDRFLPDAPDSLKTGYTAQQLEWCKTNEGLIWNYIVTNENLYTVDPVSIQQYIGEAPFTQTMSEASPGNIGPWVGWQIVKKFVANHSSLSPDDIMKTEPKKILEEAKYKPK